MVVQIIPMKMLHFSLLAYDLFKNNINSEKIKIKADIVNESHSSVGMTYSHKYVAFIN